MAMICQNDTQCIFVTYNVFHILNPITYPHINSWCITMLDRWYLESQYLVSLPCFNFEQNLSLIWLALHFNLPTSVYYKIIAYKISEKDWVNLRSNQKYTNFLTPCNALHSCRLNFETEQELEQCNHTVISLLHW